MSLANLRGAGVLQTCVTSRAALGVGFGPSIQVGGQTAEQSKRLGALEQSVGAAGGLVPEEGEGVKELRKFALPALSFTVPCKTLSSVK